MRDPMTGLTHVDDEWRIIACTYRHIATYNPLSKQDVKYKLYVLEDRSDIETRHAIWCGNDHDELFERLATAPAVAVCGIYMAAYTQAKRTLAKETTGILKLISRTI